MAEVLLFTPVFAGALVASTSRSAVLIIAVCLAGWICFRSRLGTRLFYGGALADFVDRKRMVWVTEAGRTVLSLGLLLNDKSLHTNLNKSLKSLDSLMSDIKAHPSRYINVTVFGSGGKKKD